MMFSSVGLRLMVFPLCAFAAARAQEPTFSSQSNLVLVPALVEDAHGQVVYGLRAEDFVIEDDGVEQKINLEEAAESEPVSLIVAIQCGREARRELPRMRGLSSMLEPILSQPQNQIAVVVFDSLPRLLEDFSHDGGRIDEDLRNLQSGDGGAAILDAVQYSLNLFGKMTEASHRVLLLISETRDHGSHWGNLNDIVALLGTSNATVYALAFSPALSNLLDTERGRRWDEAQSSPDWLAALALTRQAMRKNTPRTIAAMSGGEFKLFESRQRFETRLNDFMNHLHSRYLLSFEPKDPHPGLHRLRVRLKNPQPTAVLSRSSYWAGGAGP
jgi:VWFA-related protein